MPESLFDDDGAEQLGDVLMCLHASFGHSCGVMLKEHGPTALPRAGFLVLLEDPWSVSSVVLTGCARSLISLN